MANEDWAWEYLVVEFYPDGDLSAGLHVVYGDVPFTESDLNKLGKEGWEVIEIVSLRVGWPFIWLKRKAYLPARTS